MKINPTKELTNILRSAGSNDPDVSYNAMKTIAGAIEAALGGEKAKALDLPLRKGVMPGDIVSGIFEEIVVPPGPQTTVEFPLHWLAPGTEVEHVAYSVPQSGYIPQAHIEGDYTMVPVYKIANSIDWNLEYAENARWDIIEDATQVFMDGFTKKKNDDGFHTLITAGADRNIIVLDSDAQQAQFTKRLVSLGKLVMRRNGGGNSTSINRGELTDLFLSPERMEDVRNWNVDQVDEVTRRQIFLSENDQALSRIFGVNLHVVDELGEGQEYQSFYTTDLGGSLPAGDVEIMIGLDLKNRRSFVNPVAKRLEVFPDPMLHRMQMDGIYGWQKLGYATLDNRNVILLSA